MTSDRSAAGSMRALEIVQAGGADVLRVVPRPIPTPGAGEILVKVAAAGLNRVDILQRTGLYTPPAGTTDIPGVEFSGTVAALGDGTTRFHVGDPVCGIVSGGAQADYCVAPAGQVLPVPSGLDLVQAATVPETFFTVWTALFDHGHFKPGETLLVHGGTSGIGTTAIMLARALGAGAIFTTAGSDEKCAACERLGATRAINYRGEDFASVIRETTGGRGVDVILDIVAGTYAERNISLLADDGRLVLVGRMSQVLEFKVHVQRIMYHRLVLTGVSLRGQTIEQKTAIARQVEHRVWPLLEAGTIAPIIDSRFPLEEAQSAHRRLETSAHIGKIVLTL